MRRDPAGPGSRGGNWQLDTQMDVLDYGAEHPDSFAGLRFDGGRIVAAFTDDLDGHLARLRAYVEHPELVDVEAKPYALAKLEADITTIRERLSADPRRPWTSCGPGSICLRAPFVDLAAELHAEYGDALAITVGNRPYPPERITRFDPLPIPEATVEAPGVELTITCSHGEVEAGDDLAGTVTVRNAGDERVEALSGVVRAGVRRDGDDHLAGTYTGVVFLLGIVVSLAPGASQELELRIGTASCLPDAPYVPPPGRYEVIATVPFMPSDRRSPGASQLIARGAWIALR